MLRFFYYVLFLLFIFLQYSCAPKIVQRQSQFSDKEIALIHSADSKSPMRILTIENTEDSLFLRRESKNLIPNSNDPELQYFGERLLESCSKISAEEVKESFQLFSTSANPTNLRLGTYLAAPQVGISKQLIWIPQFGLSFNRYEAYFNPKVISYSNEKQSMEEECASISGIRKTIQSRAKTIMIEYSKFGGSFHREQLSDLAAIQFQHAVDHLNGVLFTDYD